MARSSSRKQRGPSAKRQPPHSKDPFGLREPISSKAAILHRRVAVVLLVLFAGLLLWVALGPHKIGDYYTETDFYGSYADGARLIQNGHFDAARYTVVGPVYEFCVAVLGFVIRDPFKAAEVLSFLAVCGTLVLWFGMLTRLAGSGSPCGPRCLSGQTRPSSATDIL